MGGEVSKAAPKINGHQKQAMASHDGGRANRPTPLLNPRQQDLLRKSWQHSHSCRSDSVGARIFRKIFVTEPSVARIFGLEGVEVKDLTYNPNFLPHADRFTKSLDFIIKNVCSTQKISQYAQALGARHVKFQSLGFKTAYWDVFAEAMTECAIDWEGGVVRCREAMHAWRVLVTFFIDQMRIGFDEERRENASHSAHSNVDDGNSPTFEDAN